jgi:molybdate/tungstate transport system substrate-binding protein
LANQLWETFMLRLLRYVILALPAFPAAASADGTVNVLYAGSLVNLMERGVGPAFSKATGDQFCGYAGGSNKVAYEIKGGRGDIFISANPKVNEQLMGAANGDWVRWYILFAESPLGHRLQHIERLGGRFQNQALV